MSKFLKSIKKNVKNMKMKLNAYMDIIKVKDAYLKCINEILEAGANFSVNFDVFSTKSKDSLHQGLAFPATSVFQYH